MIACVVRECDTRYANAFLRRFDDLPGIVVNAETAAERCAICRL